jgi:alpha-D-ribose 1-methylphosphonate 5-triphosphate synthase subunit PhnH
VTAALAPGFGDAVLASQRQFRALLEAMSRPGRVVRLGGELPEPPGPSFQPASYALALALVDLETPVWLDAALRQPAVEASLRFHCGCPLVDEPGAAAFAFAAEPARLPELARFAQGTPAYPDRSTTLVLQVAGLEAGGGAGGGGVRLTGPGIDGAASLAVAGLAPGFWGEFRANHGMFPQGVDVVLVAGRGVAALPRSTLAEVG